MRKIAAVGAVVVAGSLAVAAPVAARSGHSKKSAQHVNWEAVRGTFTSRTAARREASRLDAHQLGAFTIEREKTRRVTDYEVEREYPTQAAAAAELARMRAAGFTASGERS